MPSTEECLAALGQVPVVNGGAEVRQEGLAEIVAQALKHQRIIVVRGHGTFAIGQLLEEAYNLTALLEYHCQILCLLKSLRV